MKLRQWALAAVSCAVLGATGGGVGYLVTGQLGAVAARELDAATSFGDEPTVDAESAPTHSPTASASPGVTTGAPITSARPTSASATPGAGVRATEVLRLTNAERARKGCRPLTVETRLTRAAQAHTVWQATHGMSHTGDKGTQPWDRATAAGYRWHAVAENVAKGYGTPEAVMTGWLNSKGHRANILNCSYTQLGIGIARGADGLYWTQLFGTPA